MSLRLCVLRQLSQPQSSVPCSRSDGFPFIMSGTILERLSNRKLAVVISIIVTIQLISFFVGAIFGKES